MHAAAGAVRRGARPLRDRAGVVRRAGRPGRAGRALAALRSLPWARLFEPALRLARDGVDLPGAHAACLAMLAPVMTMAAGRAHLRAGRRAPQAGDLLGSPASSARSRPLADEGADACYRGSIAAALLDVDGIAALTAPTSRRTRSAGRRPRGLATAGTEVCTRGRALGGRRACSTGCRSSAA